MRIELRQILKSNRPALDDELVEKLRQSSAPHYQQVSEELLRGRVEKLLDAFASSSQGDSRPFVSHVEQLTDERIGEGYALGEIQSMLNLLSELGWQLAVRHSNVESLVMNLGLVCKTVGEAKDRLAQIYLARQQRADSAVVQLERKLKELFKGTESAATADE